MGASRTDPDRTHPSTAFELLEHWSNALVVPLGCRVQKRPEPVGVKETPEIPFAVTVTVPVETMGFSGAASAMVVCACL
jgi:hypothetical protein